MTFALKPVLCSVNESSKNQNKWLAPSTSEPEVAFAEWKITKCRINKPTADRQIYKWMQKL